MMKKKGRSGPPLKIPPIVQPDPPSAGPTPPLDLGDSFKTNFAGRIPEEVVVTADSLETIVELGRGAYGVVEKVKHQGTQLEFAVKRIHHTINDEEQRRTIVELQANMLTSQCPYLVQCFGAMFREGDVWICMEMMDASLDKFYKMCVDLKQPPPESAMQRITLCTLRGLEYMKSHMSLMHRDVKPSNILASRTGDVKICDFGISGHLTNSVAKTVNAGAKPYMAPERIEGDHKSSYDVRSDVWSLGISLIEIATGKHPYARWQTPFEQLKQVVGEASPTLANNTDHEFTAEFIDFINKCLFKNYMDRPKYPELMAHAWLNHAEEVSAEQFGAFVSNILDSYQAMAQQFGA